MEKYRQNDDAPPILGTWRNLYATVLGFLAFLIVLFTIFTRAFA